MRMFRLLFCCFFFSLQLFSQVDVNDNCKLAYKDILALRFDSAEVKLDQEKTLNPDNLFVPYLENYIDFLTVFISEDEKLFDELEEHKRIRIEAIKKLSDSSQYRNYMLGNINLQWAVARLKFKEYFTAAVEINRAYRLLEKNKEEFPDFVPNNISLGVLHIMIGMIPDKYHWILNLIDMEGSIVQGRNELVTVLNHSNENEIYSYLKTETLFYLGFVDINLKTDPKQIDFLLAQLEQSRQNNLLLNYLTINILMRTGETDKALAIWENVNDFNSFYPFYYLNYLIGECRLRKLQTELAKEDYQDFLNHFNGRNYIKDAWRKTGWSYLINGDTTMYLKCMKDVLSAGFTDVDVDKEAEKEAESGRIPNIELLKARLLFDGGYYKETDSTLNYLETEKLDHEEKVERFYRLGRSAHKQAKTEKAIEYYKITIVDGSGSGRYFAGNSALKLGEIYESEADLKMAEFYFQLCLDLDFDEYENSIHSKAKAGLERVKD